MAAEAMRFRRALGTTLIALALGGVTVLVGPALAQAPPDQYELFFSPDGDVDAITDLKTGLVWERYGRKSAFGVSAAQTACNATPLNGSGWRLPTYKELLTLVDESPHTQVQDDQTVSVWIDPNAFPDTIAGPYWTSTPSAADPSQVWTVDFHSGVPNKSLPSAGAYLRCVRSP
jgi:hypothetical protein